MKLSTVPGHVNMNTGLCDVHVWRFCLLRSLTFLSTTADWHDNEGKRCHTRHSLTCTHSTLLHLHGVAQDAKSGRGAFGSANEVKSGGIGVVWECSHVFCVHSRCPDRLMCEKGTCFFIPIGLGRQVLRSDCSRT